MRGHASFSASRRHRRHRVRSADFAGVRFMSDERHGNEARARDPNNRPLCAWRTLCAFRALLRTILGCTSSRGLNLIKLKAARSLAKTFCTHSA